jgi:outer membrane protein insertion porin family
LPSSWPGVGGNTKYYRPAQLPSVLPDEGPEDQQGRPQRPRLPRPGSNIAGFGGQVAPPFSRIYGGGENDLRGFDIRSSSPYTFLPDQGELQPDQPGWNARSRAIPPTRRWATCRFRCRSIASAPIGGDTNDHRQPGVPYPDREPGHLRLLHRLRHDDEHRAAQLRQSVPKALDHQQPALWLPAGHQRKLRRRLQLRPFPEYLKDVPGTNFVPRMSTGAICR